MGLRLCGEASVTAVAPHADIHLNTGESIRLSGILLPQYGPAGGPYKSWPYGQDAHHALKALLTGKSIALLCHQGQKANATDSRGRFVRHVWLPDKALWVQQALLEEGHAFAYGIRGSADMAATLFAAEGTARRMRTGLWSHKAYTVHDAQGTSLKPGWFQLVRGTVYSTKQMREKVFLNFDENWRTDFTVEVPASLAKRYAEEDAIDVAELTGKPIEVRGFLEWAGGPKIIVSHRHQLRTLATPNEQPAYTDN